MFISKREASQGHHPDAFRHSGTGDLAIASAVRQFLDWAVHRLLDTPRLIHSQKIHCAPHVCLQAYAYIRWLLDEAKEHKPPPSFDASCGPPADDMSTVWEKAEAGHPDDHEGLLDECVLAKDRIFKQQLELLMAYEPRIEAYLEDRRMGKSCLPSITEFVPAI